MDYDEHLLLTLEAKLDAPELVDILGLSVRDIWDAFYDTITITKRDVLDDAIGLD